MRNLNVEQLFIDIVITRYLWKPGNVTRVTGRMNYREIYEISGVGENPTTRNGRNIPRTSKAGVDRSDTFRRIIEEN